MTHTDSTQYLVQPYTNNGVEQCGQITEGGELGTAGPHIGTLPDSDLSNNTAQ